MTESGPEAGLTAEVGLRLGALDLDVGIEMPPGELVALLGPNGAGKTTLLKILAGLVAPDRGRVVLDGAVLDDVATARHVPVERRPVGYVFQDYLLFPHLSALENVAFGLRSRGIPKREARRGAGEWLDRVGLAEHADARPAALSGGQAQRVALARALATEPRVLLLDEPLAALDATTRLSTRRELRRQLDRYEGVRLLVTHDPLEAMALADRLVVLEEGRISQTGTPTEISRRPRSRYIADLVGLNLLRGRGDQEGVVFPGASLIVAGPVPTGEVFAVVHPRAVSLHRERPGGSPRNVWSGTVDGLDYEGERVRVMVGGTLPIVAEVTPGAVADLRLGDGGMVWVSVKATEISAYTA
ncbi:MAG: ABC transporter ATP-binding protein [Acidimicrobiia bacterium]